MVYKCRTFYKFYTYSGRIITSLALSCFCKIELVSGINGCISVARKQAMLQQIPITVAARTL